MNIFKEQHRAFIDAGYSVIPDKFMSKMPAIKDYSKYSFVLPTEAELESWSNIEKTNIALLLGEASGIVALDIDEDRPEILEVLMPMLPPSPVSKVGAKGETRFFRYTGVEHNQGLKFGGEMVVEIISNNKKTTIPPSVHPNGENYKWKDKSLLEIDKAKLPMLPPNLFVAVEQKLRLKFPDLIQESNGKLHSGRNDALVSEAAKLIKEQKPLEVAIDTLVKLDAKLHDPPLFSDANEWYHTEPRTNALQLYSNVLESINRKRYRASKEYEVPMATAINEAKVLELREEAAKKSQRQVSQRSQNRSVSPAHTVQKRCHCHICGKVKK